MALRVTRPTFFPHAPESALPVEREILGQVGADVFPVEVRNSDELLAACRGADGLINSGVRVTAAVMDAMPNCKGIITASVGFDSIDLKAATERNIPVANVPDFCTREVACQTMGLLLALVRKIVKLDVAMRNGIWERTMFHPMNPIHTETLGLVSFGRIAREVAKRALAFDMRVIAADPFVDAATAKAHGVELVDLDTLYRTADYISVHAPLNEQTRGMVSDAQFAMMKPTAMVFNTGRGPVIDEAALIRALQSGRIAGAGLDVFEQEPINQDNPLLKMDNVVLSPHSAGYSELSIATGRRLAAEEMARCFRGELPKNLVNRDLLARRA